jgi:hypothetical protein
MSDKPHCTGNDGFSHRKSQRREAMSQWITDRLPTKADQIGSCVLCWNGKSIDIWDYHAVKSGQPWMPIPKPEPYVKPKHIIAGRS